MHKNKSYNWIMEHARHGYFQRLIRNPFDFSMAHMNDARVSTSSLPLIGGISLKCLSTMQAKTVWTSSTSAKIGVRLLFSSSSKRELRRLLCSFDSRRGLLAGVVCAGGLRTRGECRWGCKRLMGGGGSSAVRGDGHTSGTISYWVM